MIQTVQSSPLDPRLTDFVRCFAQRETSPRSVPVTQSAIASLDSVLGFELGDPTVMNFSNGRTAYFPRAHILGAQTSYVGHQYLHGCVLGFAIFFRPFATWQLFGIPPAELVNDDSDAIDVFGSWVLELGDKLAEARSFSERVLLTTNVLLGFVKFARPLAQVMSTAHRLFSVDDRVSISQAARRSAMSIRSYERRFTNEIGLTPKTFARLMRFTRAIDLKRDRQESWLNISQQLGYFDQMHLVRDFHTFGGDAPGRLVLPDSGSSPWPIRARHL